MSQQNNVMGLKLSVSARDDGTLEAVYIRISNHKVAKTDEVIEDVLLVDLDSRGELVGIEILAPVKLSKITQIVEKPRRAAFRKFVKQAAPKDLVHS